MTFKVKSSILTFLHPIICHPTKGPLQYKIELANKDSLYYIVGVTSFGASCGSDIPGKSVFCGLNRI